MSQATVSELDRAVAPVLNAFDVRRLRGLIDLLRERNPADPTLDVLELELDLASVLPPREIPPTVVTMRSTVEVVDLDSDERHTYTLVFPGTGAVAAGRVSVLAPVGIALLGARVGDVVTWPARAGRRRVRIERLVYQPEAAGHFDV